MERVGWIFWTSQTHMRASNFIHMFSAVLFSSGWIHGTSLAKFRYIRQLVTQNDSSTSATSWNRCFLTNVCPTLTYCIYGTWLMGSEKTCIIWVIRWLDDAQAKKYSVDMQMISTCFCMNKCKKDHHDSPHNGLQLPWPRQQIAHRNTFDLNMDLMSSSLNLVILLMEEIRLTS